jgi:ankyrin repeat protein
MNSSIDSSRLSSEGQEVKAVAAQRENADRFGQYLLDSLGSGTLAIVQHFLDGDPNVSVRDSGGRTPLILAADRLGYSWNNNSSFPEVLAKIVELGADVNAQDTDGKTALMEASDHGNLEMVQILINAGTDVSIRDQGGNTALHYAAGSARCVAALLKAGADPNVIDNEGKTPLMKAVWYCRHDTKRKVVQTLLDGGAEPNAATNRYDSALLMACKFQRNKIINILITRGADINARDQNSRTPLMIYLHGSFGRLDDDVINMLVRGSRPIDSCDNVGQTALMYACQNRYAYTAFKALIAAGADINAFDDMGWSPLMHAAASNLGNRIETLIDRGAEVNIMNEYGNSLIAASKIKDRYINDGALVRTLKILVAAGADIQNRDYRRKNALYYLDRNERHEAASFLRSVQ